MFTLDLYASWLLFDSLAMSRFSITNNLSLSCLWCYFHKCSIFHHMEQFHAIVVSSMLIDIEATLHSLEQLGTLTVTPRVPSSPLHVDI